MLKLITVAALAIATFATPRSAVGAQGKENVDSRPFLLAIASQPLPRGERATVIRTAKGA